MASLGTHGKFPVSQHQGQRRARVTASEMRPVSSGTRCLVDAAFGRCPASPGQAMCPQGENLMEAPVFDLLILVNLEGLPDPPEPMGVSGGPC